MVKLAVAESLEKLKEWVKIDGLNDPMQETMALYLASLHHLSEGSKEIYLVRLRRFVFRQHNFFTHYGPRCLFSISKPNCKVSLLRLSISLGVRLCY